MTIQSIGAASVALYITPADLREHGLTPAQLTLEQALELTQSAFRDAGIALDGAIEIEAYPDACGVLVFAHVHPKDRLWVSFRDFEDLLEAVRALSAPCPEAALTWFEGRYWLSLPPEADRQAQQLSEFGRPERPLPLLGARLAEHGQPILEQDAFGALLRHFPSV